MGTNFPLVFILSLCVCMFYSPLFLSPLVLFEFTVKRSVISPPQTHKTNPCSYNCVICFSLCDWSCFSASQRQVNPGKWEEEGTEQELLLSFTFLILCSYEIHNFLPPLLLSLLSLFPETWHQNDIKVAILWPKWHAMLIAVAVCTPSFHRTSQTFPHFAIYHYLPSNVTWLVAFFIAILWAIFF